MCGRHSMSRDEYQIEFLPAADRDLIETARYVARELDSPKAAEKLVSSIIESIDAIASMPYANPIYLPIRPLAHEFRKLLVKNYLVLYWVDEERRTITIARVVYARRNPASHLTA